MAILAWVLLLYGAGLAQAEAPSELFRFPSGTESGETGGLLRSPTATAASAFTGHLYIAESGNSRISEFTSNGAFVRAWGWGVVAAGPGNKPQNERQEVSLTASGGSFTLVFNNPLSDGGSVNQQTGPIAFDASAATVQLALEELESPAPGDISVSGPAGGPWTFEFVGKYADTDVAPLQVDTSTLTGTAAVTTLQGGANFEICEAAENDVCRAGQRSGFSPGELRGSLIGLAIGADGSVFVLEEDFGAAHTRIQKFQPNGEFELMLGGEVNKTTTGDVCSKGDLDAGAECGRGIPGNAPGSFSTNPFASQPSRLAVGPDGTLYVGDEERISKFEADGTFQGDVPATGFVQNLTVDSSGNFYVAYFEKLDIFKLNPVGAPASPGTFPLDRSLSMAVDSAGNLYAIHDPPGFGHRDNEPRVVKFGPSGNKLIPTPEEEAKKVYFATGNISGLATLRCPAGKGLGALYVSDFSGHVTAYGSSSGCEVTPPKITDRFAVSVASTSATIGTRINPNGAATTYYVEYGTEPCDTSTCFQQPAAPGRSLEDEGGLPVFREVELGGLQPGTTYHYRVVANTVESEEGTFTTRRAGDTAPLPDGRAYEMVSPPEKNNADIAPQGGLSTFLMQAAETGPGLVYPSSTPFADPQSAPPSSSYRAARGAAGDWSTQNISPAGAALEQQVKGLSADLSTAAIVSSEPPLCCGAVNGIKNLYLRDLDTGAYSLVTTEQPRLTVSANQYCVGLQGFTPGFQRVFFKANGALTPDAPEGPGWSLYEWTAQGGIALVSVLPGETPAPPGAITNFGHWNSNCEAERLIDGAISADGTKAIWTTGSALYARVDGTETVQLDLPQGGPGPAGSGLFRAASNDASKVFFTADSPLTPGAHAGDLYRYDFGAPLGSRLIDLTTAASAAEVQGVVDASDTGDAVYFVAGGVLAENVGAAVEAKGVPQKAKAGANNLYLWQEDVGTRFIARMSPVDNAANPTSDASAWDIAPASRNAVATADAGVLAITSIEPLTGSEGNSQLDGEATRQVFLYDAGEGELVCASCNPTNARPLGGAATTGWKTAFSQPRFLVENGGRLFFESFDALAGEDHNSSRDVYEFERAGVGNCETTSSTYWSSSGGCLDLISSGAAGSGSNFFLDASASGDEVFISTAERLVGIDTDEKYDAYDVRKGGKPQVEPPLPPECNGTTILCPPPPPDPPAVTPPASNPRFGSGKCPKGKVRRKGRCVRKHKAGQRQQGKNNKHRGRGQGGGAR